MYACEYEVPAGAQMYQAVKAEMGEEPAKGLIAQLVVESGAGLRHTMVFESAADWEGFRDERIAPAVAHVLAANGISPAPPRPPERELTVVDVQAAPAR